MNEWMKLLLSLLFITASSILENTLNSRVIAKVYTTLLCLCFAFLLFFSFYSAEYDKTCSCTYRKRLMRSRSAGVLPRCHVTSTTRRSRRRRRYFRFRWSACRDELTSGDWRRWAAVTYHCSLREQHRRTHAVCLGEMNEVWMRTGASQTPNRAVELSMG